MVYAGGTGGVKFACIATEWSTEPARDCDAIVPVLALPDENGDAGCAVRCVISGGTVPVRGLSETSVEG